MRLYRAFYIACVVVTCVALPRVALAELEAMEVHGQVRIRGNLAPGFAAEDVPGGMTFGFNEAGSNDDFYNMLAEVNFTAKMSNDVTGFVALRSYDIWGIDAADDSSAANDDAFAGLNSVQTTADFTSTLAGAGNDTVGLYQAYIQLNNVGGYPVQVRIGRQEIVLGRDFILGNNDAGVNYSGIAYDGFTFVYNNGETFFVGAGTAKVVDTRNAEQDGDIDLNCVFGTYYGHEAYSIDAYWIGVDNGFGSGAVPGVLLGDESEFIHTVGTRVYGTALEDQLTYNVEVAHQFGQVNAVRPGMPPVFIGLGPAANRSLDVDAWVVNAQVGYTFADVQYTPEAHFEYAHFSGDSDITDDEYEQFSRLGSDVHYGKINLGGDLDEQMTNVNIFRLGGSIQPTEKLTLYGDVLWFILDEDQAPFGAPISDGGGHVIGRRLNDSEDDLGTEVDLWATFQYSEDLLLSAGWSHFFVGDAAQSAFSSTGNLFAADDDLDYLWWEAQLLF